MPKLGSRLASKRIKKLGQYLVLIQDKRIVLTMEDLSSALSDHGVPVRKPEYYS
jgi:hypothetical protein